jgi:flavin-dependent dehydrogenase
MTSIETLPANAYPVMCQLRLQRLLESHRRYTGNLVVWGSRRPVMNPENEGWCLDRPFFDQQLRGTARDRGVRWKQCRRLTGAQEKEDHIIVSYIDGSGSPSEIKARFAVDASGRRAVLARCMGVERKIFHRLTAYTAVADREESETTGILEAVEDGWWYAVPGSQVIQFFTDQHLKDAIPGEKLLQTRHLKDLSLRTTGARPASTSCLKGIAGNHWLAVGDAACTYDPLSSYGLTAALGGGIYAALAIRDHLNGMPDALPAYGYLQQQAFDRCLAMLAYQYSLEDRWPASPFYHGILKILNDIAFAPI